MIVRCLSKKRGRCTDSVQRTVPRFFTTWLPLEYELQLVYGKENVQFSPWLHMLSRKIDEWTEKKIQEEGDGSRNRKKE